MLYVFAVLMFFSPAHSRAAGTCTVKAYELVNYHYDAAVLLWGPSTAVHNQAFRGSLENWQDCFGKARQLIDQYPTYWKDSIDIYWYGVDHMYFHWEFSTSWFGSDVTGDVNIFSTREPVQGNAIQNSKGELLPY